MSAQAPTALIDAAVRGSAQRYLMSPDAFHSLGCMEGVYEPVVAPAVPRPAQHVSLRPGYVLAVGVSLAAYVTHYLPFEPFSVRNEAGVRHPISAAIIAILVGVLLRNVLTLPGNIKGGCRHIVKKLIPVAIVCTGAGLNLLLIASIGVTALAITVVCLLVGVVGGIVIGRMFGLSPRAAMLLGAGTGICGNSAIAAVAPLVDADDDDVVLSIGAVNLLGLVAMLTWPFIGRLLSINSEGFGIWCGTTIHAVPQVVAAGFAFSPAAGAVATIVKLARVTMLAPLVFVLAILHSRHRAAGNLPDDGLAIRYARLVPWFVWGFLGLALLNTLGLIPTLAFPLRGLGGAGGGPVEVQLAAYITWAGELLLTLAMAASGLDVNLRELVGVGGRAVLAGVVSTIVLAAASLAMIALLL
jgi:uncharacterized integral membrane protein (TIGR00698 family)